MVYLPLDSDDESDLGLTFDEERSLSFSVSLGGNESSIGCGVFIEIFLGVGGSSLSSGSSVSFSLGSGIFKCLQQFCISSLLL